MGFISNVAFFIRADIFCPPDAVWRLISNRGIPPREELAEALHGRIVARLHVPQCILHGACRTGSRDLTDACLMGNQVDSSLVEDSEPGKASLPSSPASYSRGRSKGDRKRSGHPAGDLSPEKTRRSFRTLYRLENKIGERMVLASHPNTTLAPRSSRLVTGVMQPVWKPQRVSSLPSLNLL